MRTVRKFKPILTAGLAEPLHRALRMMFTAARRPAPTAYDQNLVERIQAGRVAIAEHLAQLVLIAIARGVPQTETERLGHTYLALVRREYARAEGRPIDRATLLERVRRLAHVESIVQGAADAEVGDALGTPIPVEIFEACQATAQHARAQVELLQALEDLALCDDGIPPLSLSAG